ncbi:protein phosphatase 2A structural subunit [Starmerella bacillaris]|uniref:Protein phosphatase 2A structural subunit n=1 Tax=Starmerella bacillaris TaxID=1247836 RepID=A0AAV5RMB4_STABA|nr:protein phosphatase 2A structural subunit [Starmerella bacillaris]
MSDGDVYPLAILIDELKHDDVAVRVAAMKRLSTVALALGEERTRDELVPFLLDVAKEDEDEILTVLGEQLGQFSDYVGGPEYLYVLLDVLANLAVSEEPIVRDTAIKSLGDVAVAVPPAHLIQHFVPLIMDLVQSDWFSSRIAAASLFPVTVECLLNSTSHDSEIFKQLFQTFGTLVSDEAPMVRRAAGTSFPAIIKAMPADSLSGLGVIAMYKRLSEDEQDSVKLLAVDVSIALAEASPALFVPVIVEPVFGLLDNRSWRVKYQAADRFSSLAKAISLKPEEAEKHHDKILHLFVSLTNDPEAEVRTAIAKQVVDYVGELSQEELINQVVPCLENLTNDVSESVRESLAGNIAGVSPILGKRDTVEYLLPIFLQMLRDEHSEVRLRIISSLDVINEVIGVDKLGESLLPAISDLAKDKQWRVLLAVIEYSPLLAKQLGVDFFDQELIPLVITWLWDPVWAIRDAAAVNLLNLADVFGIEWLESEIVPKLVNFHHVGQGYLARFTALLAIKKICHRLTIPTLVDIVLPLIIDLSDDPVPNVRFNCATTFGIIISKIGGDHKDLCADDLMPILQKLSEDEDVDVRFYASKALKDVHEAQPQLA